MFDKARFLNCNRLFKPECVSVQWCINGQRFYSRVFKDNVAFVSFKPDIFYYNLVWVTENESFFTVFC